VEKTIYGNSDYLVLIDAQVHFATEDTATYQRLRENEDTHNALVAAAEHTSSQPLPMLSAEDKYY
jgi:hypothetical protein